MLTEYIILLVIVCYTSLKLVFCVCILGQSRANSLSLLTVLTSNSLMSAGTRSPTLMCTISPGTRFRARNVSSCPSRKLKTNCMLDNRVIYIYIYIHTHTHIYIWNEITGSTEYLFYGHIYIKLHNTPLSQSSAQQLPINVPTKAGYLCTMLRSVIQTLLTSTQQLHIQHLKTEFNLCWTSHFHIHIIIAEVLTCTLTIHCIGQLI